MTAPSTLASLRKNTILKGSPRMYQLSLSSAEYLDKVRGCWIGKNCGGTLGTPIEEALGREEPFDIWWYPELREGGLPNDDLEMQLVWLTALEQVGPDLKARDLARYWLDHIGYNFDEYGLSKTNLRLGLVPPVSGAYNNWFVDCMGCPIRTEVWACVAPGNPRLAARYAFEDAICDHAGGESVFGSLFNVAVQASAFVIDDRKTLIDIAMSYIPEWSKTALAVRTAVAAFDEGVHWQEARRRVLRATPHYNAQYSPLNIGFQTIGLLYGADFGEAMCITVNCGYDTDSSTGTTGSWWGIIDGAAALPEKWTAPFGEHISTNESWGGVRHLTDGTTDIPQNLGDVVSRVAAAAKRVLAAAGELEGDSVTIDPESLWADDSIRELWTRDPMTVDYPGSQFGVSIAYDNSPAAGADSVVTVTTTIRNPHPDSVTGTAELWVPSGWERPATQTVAIEAAGSTAIAWQVRIPGRESLDNSNRLFFSFHAAGYPAEPAIPVPLIGATVAQVSPSIPLTGGTSLERLTSAYVDATLLASLEPVDGWREASFATNALTTDAMPAPGTARFVKIFFEAPEDVDVRLGIDASGPSRAWLNGQELFAADRRRGIRPSYAGVTDGYTDTALHAGWNVVAIELVREIDDPEPECHVLLSTGDVLHHGLPNVGRTRLPWD